MMVLRPMEDGVRSGSARDAIPMQGPAVLDQGDVRNAAGPGGIQPHTYLCGCASLFFGVSCVPK